MSKASNTSPTFRNFVRNEKVLASICADCGAPSLKGDFNYIKWRIHLDARNFFMFTYGSTAFVIGYAGKDYVRIYCLAVRQSAQRRGYGHRIMNDVIRYARSLRKHRITLRANINERADVFYSTKFGFVRDEIKEDKDYEMHKELTYANE